MRPANEWTFLVNGEGASDVFLYPTRYAEIGLVYGIAELLGIMGTTWTKCPLMCGVSYRSASTLSNTACSCTKR